MFLSSYQYIRSYNPFPLKLQYYKTSSKFFLHGSTANWVLLSESEWILNYIDLKKFYFTRLLTVVSASLCYLDGLLLIYTLLEQERNSYICADNNNLKEKRIIKFPVNYTSLFKNAKTIR